MNILSKNIQYLMDKNSINKNQLAKILSIPSMSIGRWVNGKVTDPSLSKLLNLSNFFEISIDDLVAKNLEVHDKLKTILTEYVHIPYFEWNESIILENNPILKTIRIPKILNTSKMNNIYSIIHDTEYHVIYPKNAILVFSKDLNIKPNTVLLVRNTTLHNMIFIQCRNKNEYRSILTHEKIDIEQYLIEGVLINIILHNVF